MNKMQTRNPVSLAVATVLAAGAMSSMPLVAAADSSPGHYLAGDVHNHTTCSDGAISMEKLVSKATDKSDGTFGLDWFVQAGHGGNGNRNCTLVEDASLGTPAYPFDATKSPQTTWEQSGVTPKGDVSGTSPNRNMWRWQSVQEYQYPLIEYLNAYKNRPLFLGVETVAPGHEHTSASVITGQIPANLRRNQLSTTSPYSPLGSGTALAQWEYCFDRADTDTSRGVGNNWNCSVPGSLNASDPSWNTTAQKLIPAGGAGTGTKGHAKTVEALKWMAAYHPRTSYYLPTHLERAGPFYADGNQGFNVEHLRDFNNAAPRTAFGFETQPGHGASSNRGEYQVLRNSFGAEKVDSVGGTTFGGTGVYGAIVGGVWDAMLGEGRNFWFFASSDWHNRGSFGPDDRRSTQDFYPGEYQRSYTLVRGGSDHDRDHEHDHGRDDRRGHDHDRRDDDRDARDRLSPQSIVDGMRTGNVFTSSGQLIDRLAFVVCTNRAPAAAEAVAVEAALRNEAPEAPGCATMGEKLRVWPGQDLVVSIVVRDPAGTNYSPYTFANPSLAQIGITQPLNKPVLDHVDLIRGLVSGYRTPGTADYAGEWPRNTNWLRTDGTTVGLSAVPPAAKNTTAAILRTFNGAGQSGWDSFKSPIDGTRFLKMTYRIRNVAGSQYLRLRGTNLPPATPWETDADGNPLSDLYTNQNDTTKLKIPCKVTGTNVPAAGVTYTKADIDGCPAHLPVINGVKYVAFDVAAWSDLWFYSNPVYVEVAGSTLVAGVK